VLVTGEHSYSPNSCFNVNDPDEIIAAKDVLGVTEIFKITRIASNNFSSEQITTANNYDQWRPFTVENNQAFWLNKKIYDSYELYTQDLIKKDI